MSCSITYYKVPAASVLEQDLARGILAVTQTRGEAAGRRERFSPFPQQLSVLAGSNADEVARAEK